MATALDVGAFVLARLGPMDTWKLQKLVYYSQAWHVALFDDPLFNDPIQAWPDGPVTPELFRVHKGRRMVHRVPNGNPRHLTHSQGQLVDLICDQYGRLSGPDLSDMTHRERPWREAREFLKDREPSKRPIKHQAMRDFYRARELDGRTAADLLSGGLWPTPLSEDDDVEDQLEQIRLSIEDPADHPDQAGIVSAQFSAAPPHRAVARERGATRPARLRGRAT